MLYTKVLSFLCPTTNECKLNIMGKLQDEVHKNNLHGDFINYDLTCN
jgi:hypothetical protein